MFEVFKNFLKIVKLQTSLETLKKIFFVIYHHFEDWCFFNLYDFFSYFVDDKNSRNLSIRLTLVFKVQ